MKLRATIFSLLILILLSLFLAGFLKQNTLQLNGVEIREYRGQKLSSVNDVRENAIKGIQYIDVKNYTLEVAGLAEKPANYTYDEVLQNQKYSKIVTIDCVEGWSATILWEGVLVKDIIGNAKPGANTVIFYASDGYSTSLPLQYIIDNNILLAYRMNNVTIPPERGFPFQLVAESKWGYKWIKWVTKIEVSDNESYRGYWESRGYSDTGNINESFIK